MEEGVDSLLQDVPYTLRTLRKSPALQPRPFREPERIVRVFDDVGRAGAKDIGMSVPELDDLQRPGVFKQISAIVPLSSAHPGNTLGGDVDQENVGHMLDLEPLWFRRAEQYFAAESELAPADLTNRATAEANHNARNIDDLLSGFRAARLEFVRMLTNADDTIVTRTGVHSRLKRELRLIDHMEFVAEHGTIISR